MENNRKKEIITTLAVLLVIVVIVTGVILTKKKDSNSSVSDTSTQSDTTQTEASNDTNSTSQSSDDTTSSETATDADEYKDGSYTATGTYSTPEGNESITVTVTVADDVITDVSSTASMKSNDSKEYAGEFLANYKSQVVGKDLKTLKLGRVSGSSLTPQGFNSALTKIRTEAAA